MYWGWTLSRFILPLLHSSAGQHSPLSSPEAALLLVSTKNHDLWVLWVLWVNLSGKIQHRTSAIHWLPVTLRVLRVESDYLIGRKWETKSLRMLWKLDLIRGHEFWCWLKEAPPLERKMQHSRDSTLGNTLTNLVPRLNSVWPLQNCPRDA